MFSYLAILDYEHLDNGIFLNAFAQAVAQQGESRGVIIHGDSAYTERIMQTGVIREEAQERSIRDLNNRLVALLADNGVSCIGLNGYQRDIITTDSNGDVTIDIDYLNTLPPQPLLLLSNLVRDQKSGGVHALNLADLAYAMQQQFGLDAIFSFSLDDKQEIFNKDEELEHTSWKALSESVKSNLPEVVRNSNFSLYLTNTHGFSKIPKITHGTYID